MEMKNIKIGVIADDFTGAGDAASFLEKSGAETIMYNAVPNELQVCNAAVIALKTRSVSPHEAVAEAKKAVDFLKENGCILNTAQPLTPLLRGISESLLISCWNIWHSPLQFYAPPYQ